MRTYVVGVAERVEMENDAPVWRAGTVTLAGMVAGTVRGPPFDSAFDNVTTAPPDGAAALSVTVPVDDAPPTRSTGLMFNPLTPVGPPGVISSSVWTPGLPASPAKMFMLNCEVTANVVIVKVALVAPAGTVTLLGICATFAGAGVESATTVAPR